MNQIQTGIAVALALIVIGIFFLFPTFSPLGGSLFGTPAGEEMMDINQPQTPMSNSDQLQVTDEVVGTGAMAEGGDTVSINYVGSLENGKIFDASANHGQAFTFQVGVGQVIPGFDHGILGMKEGGKRKLIIPAALAYGAQAVGDIIPANSILIFEVELVKVVKAQ